MRKCWCCFFVFFGFSPASTQAPAVLGLRRPQQRQPASIGPRWLMHIPPQREAPCFYMNEHGRVVGEAERLKGTRPVLHRRGKLLFDTGGMQSWVQFCEDSVRTRHSYVLGGAGCIEYWVMQDQKFKKESSLPRERHSKELKTFDGYSKRDELRIVSCM